MNYLAIIRHGEFDGGETKLNEIGKKQMADLVSIITPLKPQGFSSIGPRSVERANILARELHTRFESFEFFGSSSREGETRYYLHAYNFLDTLSENAVIVTKGEWANEFIPYFCKKALNIDVLAYSLERGTGVLIDCKEKLLEHIP